MLVKLRLFGSLREAVGRSELQVDLPETATPEDAWRFLVGLHPALASRRASLVAAVNRSYTPFHEPLAPGDEVVFLPPVSGGLAELGLNR